MTVVNQVRTVWTGLAGTPYYSNLFFRDTTDPQQAASAVALLWDGARTSFSAALTARVQPEVISLTAESGVTVSATVINPGAPIPGSQTGEPLPGMVQGLIRLQTGQYVDGKRVSGRIFLPGATEQDSFNGSPIAAYLTVWEDALGAYLNSLASQDGPPVVWSRPRAATQTKPFRPGALFSVSGANVETEFATLRSRSARG